MNKKIVWINANAGSGKTTYLLDIIKNYLAADTKHNTSDILCLTFSTAAATEINHRIQKLNPTQTDNFETAQTLHAFCLKLLQKYNPHFKLIDSHTQTALWNQAFEAQNFPPLDFHILQAIKEYKNIGNKKFTVQIEKIRAKIQKTFNEYKEKECLIDFNDILQKAKNMLESAVGLENVYDVMQDIKVLLIDESQDLSKLQWSIIFSLIQEIMQLDYYQIHVVGDQKQSIFSFQGADLEIYQQAQEGLQTITAQLNQDAEDKITFKNISFDQTYRCPKNVCEYVDTVFSMIPTQFPCQHKTACSHPGQIIFGPLMQNKEEWMEWMKKQISEQLKTHKLEDIMILIRKRNILYTNLTQYLNASGLQTHYQDKNPFALFCLNLLSYKQYNKDYFLHELLTSPLLDINLETLESTLLNIEESLLEGVSNLSPVLISIIKFSNQTHDLIKILSHTAKALQITKQHFLEDLFLSHAQKPLSVLEAIDYLEQKQHIVQTNSITIQTIHSAKGKESKIVFLCDTTLNPNLAPIRQVDNKHNILTKQDQEYDKHREEKRQKDIEENQRLLYVALTRAQQTLIISNLQTSKTLSPDSWYPVLLQAFEKNIEKNQ